MIPGISQSSCHPRTEWVIDSKSKSWIKISRELVVRRRKSYICGRLVGVSATVGWRRHDTYCLLRARTRGEAPTCVRLVSWCVWVLLLGWGWGPLISDIATTKTRPGTRPEVEQQTAAAGTTLRSDPRGVASSGTVPLLHCHTVTLHHGKPGGTSPDKVVWLALH